MPDISQQLIDQVNAAIADKAPVRIQGGGTKSGLGRAINTEDNLISTQGHSGVVEYKPVELIMTVRGGTTLAEIDAELAKNNQMLACDPPPGPWHQSNYHHYALMVILIQQFKFNWRCMT